MLYLKKNNDTQTAFIPKNGSYEGKLSYKEGYEAGKAEGIAEGKNNPYSTKGFFFENGEKEYIYPVRINRDTMLQISFLGGNTSDYVEISFYPMGNGCVLANQNDSNIVCAMRGDLLRVFIYNTLQFELPCKQEEWHTLRLYTDRVILDGEETYFNTPYTGGSYVCACVNRGGNGFYRGLIQYIKGVEDEAVMYYISDLEKGGFKRLRSDNGISDWYENNFVPVWGAFPVMQAKAPLNSVFINVEGGNVCPELTVLDVDSNGRYEGAFSAVNVNVPDVNGSYDEGYNNGYNDGKAEGGSCNIEETRWAEPTPADVDGSGYLVYHKSEGYDGMDRVALNMNGYNALKYNEGYEAGKAEGGSCNLSELNIEWQSDWNENNYYADKQGYDGYSYVHIDATTALKEKYDEGYEAGKAEGGDCDYQDYRELVLRAKVENAGFVDENTFWDKSKIIHYDEYNEKTANTIMFFDIDTEGWRGEYVTIVQKVSQAIRIDEGLFTNLEEIYELEIECTAIGENAFNGCTNLTKLVLTYPSTIGENAFKDCTNLKEIVFNTIGDISPSAFDGCPKTGIIKVKDNRFDPSKLPSTLSNWKIIYVEDNEVAGIIDVAKYGIKFGYSQFDKVPDFYDFSNVTDMSNLFRECTNLIITDDFTTQLKPIKLNYAFYNLQNMTKFPKINLEDVIDFSFSFYNWKNAEDTSECYNWYLPKCKSFANSTRGWDKVSDWSFLSNWGITKDANIGDMISGDGAITVPAIENDGSGANANCIFSNSYSDKQKLTYFGGYIGRKASVDNAYQFAKMPNLTYESCISILNNLYDFVGNNETPSSSQGKLKVHPNFLTTVGDEISIATNKGWQILA